MGANSEFDGIYDRVRSAGIPGRALSDLWELDETLGELEAKCGELAKASSLEQSQALLDMFRHLERRCGALWDAQYEIQRRLIEQQAAS